ncbi:MAG: DUF4115 domain-containing protein [Candidatus Zixiibacteriota bacterium]|nr:MAG: DUF4115 domain-containing protein [candidate division Zixibacteria bacterium]
MSELHIKLGKLLQLERQRRGLALEDIAEELKITATNLEAIESGDADALPSELYFGLFAKTYAERLGIDYSRTTDAIMADLDTQEEEPAPTSRPTEIGEEAATAPEAVETEQSPSLALFSRKLVVLVASIVGLFIIAVVVWEIFIDQERAVHPGDAGTEQVRAVADPESESSSPAVADYDWNVPEYPPPDKIQLTLVAREESWATIVADGDTVIYRSLIPWREYVAEADYRFRVSIGIPSRVETKLNGQLVNLRNPATRRISRVEINQINLSSFLDGTYYAEIPSAPALPRTSPSPQTDSNLSDESVTQPANSATDSETETPPDPGSPASDVDSQGY